MPNGLIHFIALAIGEINIGHQWLHASLAHILAGKHMPDARNRKRCGTVNGLDFGMGMGRAEKRRP